MIQGAGFPARNSSSEYNISCGMLFHRIASNCLNHRRVREREILHITYRHSTCSDCTKILDILQHPKCTSATRVNVPTTISCRLSKTQIMPIFSGTGYLKETLLCFAFLAKPRSWIYTTITIYSMPECVREK